MSHRMISRSMSRSLARALGWTPSMGSNWAWRYARNTGSSLRVRRKRYARSLRPLQVSRALSRRKRLGEMFSKSEIQSELFRVLEDLFELPPEKLVPGARLIED